MAGEASGVKAGQAYVELSLRDKMSAGLAAAKEQFNRFMIGLAAAGAGMQVVAGAGLATMGNAVGEFVSQGSQLADASARTGVAASTLSALGFAAKQTGVDLGSLEAGMKGMAKFTGAVASGNQQAASTLKALGVSAGAFMAASPEQRLGMIADGLAKVNDPGLKAALAMKALGRSGVELLPMLEGGSVGLAEFIAEAERLGIVVGDDQVAAADALGDAWDTLMAQAKALKFQIGAALAGPLTDLVKIMQEGAIVAIDFVKQNAGLVKLLAVGLVVLGLFGAGLLAVSVAGMIASGVLSAFGAVGTIVSGVMTILTAVSAAASAVNTWLAGVLTVEGLAALFAAASTSALNVVLGVLSGVASIASFALAALATPLGVIAISVVAVAAVLTAGIVLWTMYSKSGQDAVTDVVGAFGRLYQIASTTIGGIFDAIVAGNWGLAFDIAMAGVKVAWAQFKAWIEAGWIGIVGGISDLWTSLKTAVIATLFDIVAGVGRALAAAWKMVTDWDASVRASMGLEARTEADPIEATANALMTTGNRMATETRLAGARDIAASQAQRLAAVSAANEPVRTARSDLDLLRLEAQNQRDAEAGNMRARVKKLVSGFGGTGQAQESLAAQAVGSVAGTFDANVAGMMQFGQTNDHAAKTAENTRKSADFLSEILEKLGEQNEWSE